MLPACNGITYVLDSYWTRPTGAVHTVRPVRKRPNLDRKEGPRNVALIQYLVTRFIDREEGQGLAEYALILALIAIIAIVALIFLGSNISNILHTVGASV